MSSKEISGSMSESDDETLGFVAPPNDQRPRFQPPERRIRVRRNERQRFESSLLLTPSARDLHPASPVEPRERVAVVGSGRAERVQRLDLGNLTDLAGQRRGNQLDSALVGAGLVLPELRMKRRKQA